MSEESTSDPDSNDRSAPIDLDLLDRIHGYLHGSGRFERTEYRPADAPASLVLEYDLGYFPRSVERATLHVRWFQNDGFSIHYAERYESDERWECRWDRHPNAHNTRDHFHPPPDARTPGEDRSFATDWRELLAEVLDDVDERVMSFWD